MAESDIFSVKLGADYDAVIEHWIRPLFVELEAFAFPKNELQITLKILVLNALFGKSPQPKGECGVTETHL